MRFDSQGRLVAPSGTPVSFEGEELEETDVED